jgi:hypothetical protein
MKLTNKTKLNDKAIMDMIEFGHVNVNAIKTLTVIDTTVEELGSAGQCREIKKGHYEVLVTNHNDEYLETLVHELVHINHFAALSKMSEYEEELDAMMVEIELSEVNL